METYGKMELVRVQNGSGANRWVIEQRGETGGVAYLDREVSPTCLFVKLRWTPDVNRATKFLWAWVAKGVINGLLREERDSEWKITKE